MSLPPSPLAVRRTEARQSKDCSLLLTGEKICGGARSFSYCSMGIELITTFGTEYVSCRIVSALRSEAPSSILVSVSTLSMGMSPYISDIPRFSDINQDRTYSTSNQLGVIIDAFGSKER